MTITKFHLLPELADKGKVYPFSMWTPVFGNDYRKPQWQKYFKDSEILDMATFSDILSSRSLRAIKTLRNAMKIGLLCQINFEYHPNDLTATITDRAGSNKREPIVTENIEIPVYLGCGDETARMDNVLETSKGLNLMKVITGKDWPRGKLADKLVMFSGRSIKKQYIITPGRSTRKMAPHRSLELNCLGGKFNVSCISLLNKSGYAVPLSKK